MTKTTKSGFLDDYLSHLLARASHLVAEDFSDTLKAAGIDRGRWRILAALSDTDEMPIGRLAKAVLMKQPTLTKILDRMEGEDLVRRHNSPDDRRSTLIRITGRGRDMVSDLLVKSKEQEQQILKSYSDKEEQVLKHVLRTLIERME
ncbi:MarR family transcriptional regulator [Emcibacter sp.]|uniref:MarR family winged helix-turn-helix transcriptional regulator n=1 Tax=Emcibacter sp. TaxID=1979954 RepID=UPI002AA8F70D|nr:MarR family transcriptional regulator [Emcibacter sp.]